MSNASSNASQLLVTMNSSVDADLDGVGYIYIATTVFYVVVFLLGVVGNVLVIYVVSCHRGMSTPTNMFLLNLTIADLMIILVCMPTSLAEFHAKDVWMFGSFLCKLLPFLENAMSNTSILIILAISFERYHAICSPFEKLYACSKTRSVKIICLLWTTGFISALPMFFISFTEEAQHVLLGTVQVCRTPIFGFWRKFYVVMVVVTLFVIPGIILAALYVAICSYMVKNPPKTATRCLSVKSRGMLGLEGSSSEVIQNARIRAYQSQVIVMLIVIIVLFFVCLIPIKAMILVGIFTSAQRMEALGLETYLNLMSFARVMFYINSAINPVLYNVVSTRFRHAFAGVFSCLRLKSANSHAEKRMTRGHYVPYRRRSANSKTWYSEFELYNTASKQNQTKFYDRRRLPHDV